jgi:hypothetical protein
MAKSLIVSSGELIHSNNLTNYYPVGSAITSSSAESTEAQAEVPVRDAGSFSNLFTYLSTNGSSVVTITLRKSTADTSVSVQYSSGQTGIKEDSDSVAFANTDEIDFKVATGFGGSGGTLTIMGITFAPDTTTDCITKLVAAGSINFSTASVSRFFNPAGDMSLISASVDTQVEVRARTSMVLSDFHTYVSANTRTTDTVLGTRTNSANGSQSVTYTSGQTGAKEDTANSDSLSTGDDYNYRITTSTGTGTITIQLASTTCTTNDSHFPLLVGNSTNAIVITTGTVRFCGISGDLFFTATEANASIYPRFEFTAKELLSFVVSNSSASGNCVVTVRDNGADSAISVTYSIAQTGLKNDSTNTATISSGTDELCYEIDNGTNVNVTFTWLGILGNTTEVAATGQPAIKRIATIPFLAGSLRQRHF